MFHGALAFNSHLQAWDVGNVKKMGSMFKSAWAFNSRVRDWDVSSVNDMSNMFNGAKAMQFRRGNLELWDVRNVTKTWNMFEGASNFKQDHVKKWGQLVTEMSMPAPYRQRAFKKAVKKAGLEGERKQVEQDIEEAEKALEKIKDAASKGRVNQVGRNIKKAEEYRQKKMQERKDIDKRLQNIVRQFEKDAVKDWECLTEEEKRPYINQVKEQQLVQAKEKVRQEVCKSRLLALSYFLGWLPSLVLLSRHSSVAMQQMIK